MAKNVRTNFAGFLVGTGGRLAAFLSMRTKDTQVSRRDSIRRFSSRNTKKQRLA
ncbi:MAG: hypothetical protein ACRC46_00080 [Thermoguttaceae bacterium]